MSNPLARNSDPRRALRRRLNKRGSVSDVLTALVALVVIVGVAALVVGLALLSGVITMLAWNLGVVAVVAAAGGSVGKIGLVTAIFVNIAISIVGRIFRPAPTVNTSA